MTADVNFSSLDASREKVEKKKLKRSLKLKLSLELKRSYTQQRMLMYKRYIYILAILFS